MSCPVTQSDQEVTSSVAWDNIQVDNSVPKVDSMNRQEQDTDSTMPDSTSQDVVNSNALFAAALTAKLDSLNETQRGSPPDLGDYENPDSMETQGDLPDGWAYVGGSGPPSPGSRDPLEDITEFDLDTSASPNAYTVPDCDPDNLLTTTILPTFGPFPDPAQYDDAMATMNFNFNEGPATVESGDISSELAMPGVCGMRNLGNTCYMNSGLQCLLASPTVTEFFLHFSPELVKSDKEGEIKEEEIKSNTCLRLSRNFANLVQQVYQGRFTVIQPDQFKETLAESHDQFKGFRQHDCQEFLALLLDTLHEQLVGLGSRVATCPPLSECTSMELHTPHSTEVSGTEGSTVFNFSLSGKMLDKDSESEVGRGVDLDREFESVSEVGRADLENVNNIDGTESRGSASPKSYTSHSSLEDKIPTNIRMAPIPECIKADWTGQEHHADSRASLASLDSEQEEGSEEGEGAAITSNLVPNDQLKKKQVVFSDTVGAGLGVQERNNEVSPMNVGIEDFYKEHKTLNVNMNNESQAMNNKINFDSEKYRQNDNTRPPTTIENLNTGDLSEKNINVKRVKCTNMETGGLGDMNGGETDNKRIRLESREKNIMMETERKEVESESMESQTEPPNCCSEAARDPARLKEAIEADRYWEKYLAKNNTVVAHSFQGQFKNTVICGECGHVSVSFEPFMYLSVPLPRALDRQVEVVVLLEGGLPTAHLLTLSTHDRVMDLRAALTARLDLADRKLVLAEVTRHRVSRQLEDNTWLKFVNTTNRKIYCLELLSIAVEEKEAEGKVESVEDEEGVSSSMLSSLSSSRSDLCPSTTVSSSTSTGTLTDTGTITEDLPSGGGDMANSSWKSCNICLEEMVDSDLVGHIHCTAQLCRDCLERSMAASPDKCPVCLAVVLDDSEWVQLDQTSGVRPPLRMLTISVIFMAEQVDKEEHVRMGHPRLIRVANVVKLSSVVKLLESLASTVPAVYQELCAVTDTGDWCSRCTTQQRCRGCPISSLVDGGDLLLKPGDNIAIRFAVVEKNMMEEVNRARQDPSMDVERLKLELDLFDCLDAFSSREVLDHANPWFCPICRRNQTATKTLSVWRYPDFLIIYLKRFVYLEKGPGGHAGSVKLDNKVSFPLAGLDLTPYLSGPLQQGGELFDLYGAVCHYGSVSGGHYTAYAKHCQTQEWNHFNDAQVDPKVPEGESQDDMYVLFYKRSGLSHTVNIPSPNQKQGYPPPP